ncbi:MAG: histidine phosphatase family protein [Actinomycetota bacterium]|nr:histidine phosphatase family protein [Actinomycetota bacterium]
MHADLILVCHASTQAVRSGAFPADESLDGTGEADALGLATTLRPANRALCAPSIAARQTASALGLEAHVEPMIRDLDIGRWAGRPVAEVAQFEPEAFGLWMTDVKSAPHGGEALADLLQRVAVWVHEIGRTPGRTIAVTHSAVIRGAIIGATEATEATFWHLDIGPLSRTWLRSNGDRWALRSLTPG